MHMWLLSQPEAAHAQGSQHALPQRQNQGQHTAVVTPTNTTNVQDQPALKNTTRLPAATHAAMLSNCKQPTP